MLKTQLSGGIPVTIDAWESALVRYFLAVPPSGDASDIFTLEVSAATLALACGVDVSYAIQTEQAFRNAMLRDEIYLLQALKQGSYRVPTADVPNCFAPLAMTLLIDSLLDGDSYENNQFRAKLASWLGVDRTFNDLSGVKLMWEELRDWLDAQASAGRPFRRLVLPAHPKNWVHIGYTRRLSFPNRADVRAVERILASTPQSDLANPTAIINAFWNCSHQFSLSIGLKEAFSDFQQAYYSQRRALADHRFWVLIHEIRTAHVAESPLYAQLEIAPTIDDEREFRVAVQGGDNTRSYQTLPGALADQIVSSSSNLSVGVSRGLLFFTQVGMGRWSAESDLGKCRGRVLVACHFKVGELVTNWLGKVVRYDQWRLTAEPVDVDLLAAKLLMCGIEANGAGLFRAAASDGIRVNGAWLGLPGFLPLIKSDTSELCILADSGAASLHMTGCHDLRLAAESPATGLCVIEPKTDASERGPHWRLKLQFADRAAPHYELRGARRNQPLLADWSSVHAAHARCVVPDVLEWRRANDALEWLLEAVYASGASGWDECDLVDLLKRADTKAAASPWRILKMLHDGGVIQPRLRRGWKGRVWTLSTPRIVVLDSSAGQVVFAEGAFCTQMLEAFITAAQGMGATPFRLCGEARWSVPVMGAVGADPEKLAAILKWEYAGHPDAPIHAPLALVLTERHADHYLPSAVWCWRSRRFVKSVANDEAVQLILLVHPAGTDHDVYRLEAKGARTHFLSRCAAVVAAHGVAAVPLFEFDGQRLKSTGQEGGLPDALSAALRRRRFMNGGFSDGAYCYPATVEDARWLALLMPGCIAGLEADNALAPGAVLARVRRTNGAVRPQWINGQLTL